MENSTENLLTVYKRLYNRFSKIGTDFSSLDMKEIPTILDEIEFCQKKIGIESLFSKNEEMDDIMTELIKYLYLDYFHAKALLTKQDLSERKDILYTSRDLFKKFLSICVQYHLLHESEMDKLGYTQVITFSNLIFLIFFVSFNLMILHYFVYFIFFRIKFKNQKINECLKLKNLNVKKY